MYERIAKAMKEKAAAKAAAEALELTEEQKQLDAQRDVFIGLLRSLERPGMERVIQWLTEESDFFSAPASTRFHGNYPGGLAEHSLNVYRIALRLRDQLRELAPEKADISDESIAIAALLHDICKANVYTKEVRKRLVDGRWMEVEAYGVDYSELPVGHGEKSVIRLLRLGLEMTDDEILAMRWHMAAWYLSFQSAEEKGQYGEAKEQCPLLSLIQLADELAANFLEEVR